MRRPGPALEIMGGIRGKTVPFFKMQGSGNDFILIDNRSVGLDPGGIRDFVRKVCRRGLSVGADGLILLEESERADFRWHYFNADGGRAEMCGNGSRCAARLAHLLGMAPAHLTFETDVGIIFAEVKGSRIKVRLGDPSPVEGGIEVRLDGASHLLYTVNTGVPHAVEFVEDLDSVDVVGLGRPIRYHGRFAPQGTNVNFVRLLGEGPLAIRTYERGVEGETLACGTGSVAAALVAAELGWAKPPVDVQTRSGEVLQISFARQGDRFKEIDLEGKAVLVYEGTLFEEAWGKGEAHV